MASASQTLVAFRMNGLEIPVEHGGPVRLIVPGWVGTYSVKWLLRIAVLDRPWDGFWMSRAYRVPTSAASPGAASESVETVPLTTCRVNSVITLPLDGVTLPPGRAVVEGIAWSGDGEIEEVSVSTNGGKTWTPAQLEASSGPHAWRRWRLNWDAAPGPHEILARARDASGAVQPLVRTAWNPGGYGWNAAQTVAVRVAE
jgi:DMSO/TMAO reductase YedYZ molybdopterin-dependent catalytic subunit